jgi:hypothetical protein
MADNPRPPGDKVGDVARDNVDNVHEQIRALPQLVSTSTLDERAALAARLHVKRHNKNLESALKAQIKLVLDNVTPELNSLTLSPTEPHYIMSDRELRGIVAHSVNIGAMQTAHDIGHALRPNNNQADRATPAAAD